jgi:hypothetical protein
MAEDFVPRPKARLPDGGRMGATKDTSAKITPLKERPEIPFRPKPEPVPEPDGFTAEQLAAQLRAEAIRKLGDTDYVVTKAVEQARTLSQEWLDWRDFLRAIANGWGVSIPPEPARWASSVEQPEAPLLPAPDALMSDWGEVGAGYDDVTGDMLLDAFEQDEAEAASVIQVLSATRQRHLSEQLNVEKARLRREHMLTDQANPREASIDRLLGLLTRRGD